MSLGNGAVMQFVDREERGGNRKTFKDFNNKMNKHKRKAAASHGRLPYTKHKIKSRPGPLSSLLLLSSSVGLESSVWRRCRPISLTPPASLRSNGSRPRHTRHRRKLNSNLFFPDEHHNVMCINH